jgi:hypothetical protein
MPPGTEGSEGVGTSAPSGQDNPSGGGLLPGDGAPGEAVVPAGGGGGQGGGTRVTGSAPTSLAPTKAPASSSSGTSPAPVVPRPPGGATPAVSP